MSNMRQIIKRGKTSLRMADGGGLAPLVASSTPEMEAVAGQNLTRNIGGFERQSAALAGQVAQAQKDSGVPTAPVATPTAAQRLRDQQMGMATGLLNSGVRTAMPQFSSQPIAMADGGMFDSIKRAVGMAPAETMREKFARQDAERAAKAPQPVAPAAPAPQITAPMGSQSVMDRREKAAGLRDGGDLRTGHGGHVPGTGEGDKIPAKYEPGEFVVSNDMLDAQPELRPHLSALREAVLAEKGMTPEQADMKALSGGKGLRAAAGGPTDWTSRALQGQRMMPPATPMQAVANGLTAPPTVVAPPVAAPAAPAYTPPPVETVGPNAGRYVHEVQAGQRPVVASAPSAVGGGGGGAGGVPSAPGVAKPASLWGKAKAASNTLGSGAKSVASGSFLNADVGAAAGNALRSGGRAIKAVAQSPFTPASLAVGGVAGAAQGLGTDTESYRLRAGMDRSGGLGGDLLARGVGVMADVGDAITFGQATNIGNYIAGNGYGPNSTAPAPAAAKPSANVPSAGYSHEGTRAGPAGSQGVGDGPSLGATDFTAQLNSRPGGKMPSTAGLRDNVVYKTVDPRTGRVAYSGNNIRTGADGTTAMMNGDGTGLRQIDGNNSGSGTGFVRDLQTGRSTSAFGGGVNVGSGGFTRPGADVDTALHAAGARGDMDAVRAYYANKGETFAGITADQYKAQQAAAAEEAGMPKRGEFGYNRAQITKTARDANKATLRGQDMDMERAMAPIRYAQEQRRMAGQLLQQTGGDLGAATKMAMRVGVDPSHLQAAWQAETTNKTAEQNLAASKSKGVDDIFANQFSYTDKNGVKQRDQNAEALAKAEVLRASGGKFAAMSPDEQAAYAAAAMDNVKLLMSARSKQSTGYRQALGLQADDVALGGMPTAEQLQGSTLRDVGFWEGMTTPKIAKGDHRLRLRDGREMTFGRGDLTEAQLKYLTERGAKAGDK